MLPPDVEPPELLTTGPARGWPAVVLAHGAGAPMDSPFMQTIAEGLAAQKIRCVRFEFPYMHRRRSTGKRSGPDRPAVLTACWEAVIAAVGKPERTVIGGKSMGGRIASMVADEAGVAGLACLGYPFHPPGQPTKLRTAHLGALRTPALIVQGERDGFGKPDEVAGYALSVAIEVLWMPDGDHSLKPRVKSGHTEAENLQRTIEAIAQFARRVTG